MFPRTSPLLAAQVLGTLLACSHAWAADGGGPMDPKVRRAVRADAASQTLPYADDPAVVARLAALPDRTGMNLGDAAMSGEHLEPWREEFYQNGPDGRDYCIKMAYNPDRKTAFFCGGNHGTPHKLSDAWEYHLGSNAWVLLAPPEVGDPKSIIGLYGDIREGQYDAAVELVRKHVVLEDGCLVTRQTKGPINTSHTWDGLTYDPRVRRVLWAAPATGIQPKIFEELYAKANGMTVEEVRARLAPGMDQFWMYDFQRNRWVRHTGPEPHPRLSFTCTLTYVPDLGKTFYYLSSTRETWTYDAVANRWEQLETRGESTPAMELMAAYSPAHRKVVCVQGAQTWTFDVAANTWEKLADDPKNDAQDHKGFFGYDPHNDVFLLFQNNMPDRIRVFSLDTGRWTTAEIRGDGPPETRRFTGYYDPDRNVLVCCSRLSVWVYRYAGPKPRD